MENEKNETKFKYFCNICNIGARNNTEWLNHTKCKKHIRGGLKIKICNICNNEFYNHWNLKQHYIMVHASLEEKLKCKYYCNNCNIVFLSELYYNKHMIGKNHINTIKCKEELDKISDLIKIKNGPLNLDVLEFCDINDI
jgi:hypothetical protein